MTPRLSHRLSRRLARYGSGTVVVLALLVSALSIVGVLPAPAAQAASCTPLTKQDLAYPSTVHTVPVQHNLDGSGTVDICFEFPGAEGDVISAQLVAPAELSSSTWWATFQDAAGTPICDDPFPCTLHGESPFRAVLQRTVPGDQDERKFQLFSLLDPTACPDHELTPWSGAVDDHLFRPDAELVTCWDLTAPDTAFLTPEGPRMIAALDGSLDCRGLGSAGGGLVACHRTNNSPVRVLAWPKEDAFAITSTTAPCPGSVPSGWRQAPRVRTLADQTFHCDTLAAPDGAAFAAAARNSDGSRAPLLALDHTGRDACPEWRSMSWSLAPTCHPRGRGPVRLVTWNPGPSNLEPATSERIQIAARSLRSAAACPLLRSTPWGTPARHGSDIGCRRVRIDHTRVQLYAGELVDRQGNHMCGIFVPDWAGFPPARCPALTGTFLNLQSVFAGDGGLWRRHDATEDRGCPLLRSDLRTASFLAASGDATCFRVRVHRGQPFGVVQQIQTSTDTPVPWSLVTRSGRTLTRCRLMPPGFDTSLATTWCRPKANGVLHLMGMTPAPQANTRMRVAAFDAAALGTCKPIKPGTTRRFELKRKVPCFTVADMALPTRLEVRDKPADGRFSALTLSPYATCTNGSSAISPALISCSGAADTRTSALTFLIGHGGAQTVSVHRPGS